MGLVVVWIFLHLLSLENVVVLFLRKGGEVAKFVCLFVCLGGGGGGLLDVMYEFFYL